MRTRRPGINSSLTGPVTAETLLRWVNMVAALGGPSVMEVRRASVQRVAVLQYYPWPSDAVPPPSVLTPGDYGCYYTGICFGSCPVMIVD